MLQGGRSRPGLENDSLALAAVDDDRQGLAESDMFQVLGLVMLKGSLLTFLGWVILLIFAYDLVAVVWVYQAYKAFKVKFDRVMGGGMP